MRLAWFDASANAWRRWRQLGIREWMLLLEAVVWLGVARLAIRMLPFRRLSPYLGQHMAESSSDDDPAQFVPVRQVAWAMRIASRRLPWRCKCLEQGLAGKLMLRRRGISHTLYLGVATTEAGLEAHAWLRSGSFIVTGAEGRERFTVISTFAG
jgi:hypothetical protein